MTHLIIGHTTHESAHLWVREERGGEVHLSIESVPLRAGNPPHIVEEIVPLHREADYTGNVVVGSLNAGTEYRVRTRLSGDAVIGRFRTMKDPAHGDALPFSFVLSSCNLPIVRVNDLLSFLLVSGGAGAARASFGLTPDRWDLPSWLVPPMAFVGRAALALGARVLLAGTAGRQPSPRSLRSPFLKLSAVFDSWLVDLGPSEVDRLPAVGDIVTAGRARGTIASLSKTKVPDALSETKVPDVKPELVTCRLVLTHVKGKFEKGQQMSVEHPSTPPERQPSGRREPSRRTSFDVVAVHRAQPWYEEPSFFIHAGDQIYSDFPVPNRKPERTSYRRAYQEAWFDDASAQEVLSRWPHYMTLDDHEIADQYASDFQPVLKNVRPDTYLDEALAAYVEYAASRNPPGSVRGARGPFWYTFNNGRARFFVLDTRTQRNNGRQNTEPRVIDDHQMGSLLDWMKAHRDDLKFVVTSVPFVAEFDDEVVQFGRRWQDEKQPGDRLNRQNDKWSAPEFRRQRSEIIEHIHRENIEHVVFLNGDMHCCYHAVMRIGSGSKYECTTVHELAGGPLNQLQLPNLDEFRTRWKGKTTGLDGHRPIDYVVTLEGFHSQVSAVMHLKVDYVDQEPLRRIDARVRPRVEWNVIRTITDVGASGWSPQADGGSETHPGESPLGGRIDFVARRAIGQLHVW